ncbi:MAG: hypothetical protein HY907_07310 [Deltaproteobacteria bacterium]|nr:hypothetical protein [Deltaproteobacteria bacterium]
MIAADLRIDHLRPEELAAAWRFATEPPAGSRIGDVRRGLVLVLRERRPAVLADLADGFVPLPPWLPRDRPLDAAALRRLRRERGATWALAAGADAVRRLDEAVAAAFDPAADLLACALPLAQAVREARLAGELLFSPSLLDDLPIPSVASVRSAFDLVLPDDRSALLYAFGAHGLSFGFIVEKRQGVVARVAGHDALGGIAVRGAHWKAAVPRILAEAGSRFAPPAVGVFADESVLRGIVFGSEGVALPRALATRDVIVDPLPAWLGVLLGLDTAAKAAGTARSLLRRFDPLGLADRLDVGRIAGEVQRRLGAENPLARVLGFDPLAVLSRLQQWREL